MNFFRTVQGLGLGSRLKRLSDVCMSEVKIVYKASGIDFDPKWFPLFRLLLEQSPLTVMEASDLLEMTHPHISQLLKEMLEAKLIEFQKAQNDKRSRSFVLTKKGFAIAEKLQPIWDEISKAVTDAVNEADPEFLLRLEKVEGSFKSVPLSKRILSGIKTRACSEYSIINYSKNLRDDFEKLNREWLEKYFTVEDVDKKYFRSPEKEILKKGGDIFFATVKGEVLGTCSLILSDDGLELAKMAVSESARGMGLGEFLATEAIKRAREKGEKKLFLVTNCKLAPAIGLYEKLGFKTIFRGQHPKYKRGDVVMEKSL